MEDRSVAIEVVLDGDDGQVPDLEAKLDALRVAIADRGGVPLAFPDSRRYGARFCVRAPEAGAAVDEGVQAFKEASDSVGLPDATVVDVETSTMAELNTDHDPDVPIPDLVGITELAELLGVSNQLVTLLVRAKGFPAPVAELNAGPVWTLKSVNRFILKAQANPDSVESSTRPG